MNKHLLTTCTLLASTLCSSLTLANNDHSPTSAEPPPWYQVELILFSRDNPDNLEQWPHTLNLSYSANRVQFITATPEPPAADGSTAAENDTNTEGTTTTENKEQQENSASSAYKALATDALELQREARAINRKNGYKVLFHEGWQQPVLGAEEAPSIVITGGEKYGDHHTLEGEIKLSVARYLHFSTNLWLSEFEMNYGQLEHREWPSLPAPPFKHEETVAAESAFESALEIHDSYEIPEFKLHSSAEPIVKDEEPGLLREAYLPSEIIHFKQHRRMRSKELHYIDHPRIGAIIKILPIATPSAI